MDDNTNDEKNNSNTMDLLKPNLSNIMIIFIVIFVIVIVFLVFTYLGKSENQNSPIINSINQGVSSTNKLLTDQISNFSNSNSSSSSSSSSVLGIIFGLLYFILFIIIIVLLVKYFFNVDITQPIKNIFIYKTSQNPEDQLDVLPETNLSKNAKLDKEPSGLKSHNKDNDNKNKNNKESDDDNEEDSDDDDNTSLTNKVKSFSPRLQFKEVYHIPGNHYGYEESKSVCKALGGELATIKQMDDVYKKGGEWCSYGWSSNQMALFPTQYSHWNKLQTIKGHENDCGRPGINGGYIGNPNVKFGVNCYGYRPKMKPIESKLMESAEEYPISEQQKAFNKQVDHWKKKINEIIVAPFNAKKWSESDL